MIPAGAAAIVAVVWLVHVFLGLMLVGYVDSAMGTLRAIVASEVEFRKMHPRRGYSCSLSELGTDREYRNLSKNGERNGYAFKISGCDLANDGQSSFQYQAIARPLRSGLPAYCVDEPGVLMWDRDGSVAKCVKSRRPMNQ